MFRKLARIFLGMALFFILIGGVSASYTLTVDTNKNTYVLGETIQISGNLKLNGNPVQNTMVGIQVNKPNGEVFFIDQKNTGTAGQFSTSVKIPSNGVKGTYTVYASSQGVSSNTNFEVKELTCTENWDCTAWSSCVEGIQTRTCSDLNNCGTTINKPSESQFCTISNTVNPGNNGKGGTETPKGEEGQTGKEGKQKGENITNQTQENETEQPVTNQTENKSIQNQTKSPSLQGQSPKNSITGLFLSKGTTPYLLGIFLLLSAIFTYLQIRKSKFIRKKSFKKASSFFILLFLFVLPAVQAYNITSIRKLPEFVNPSQEFNVSLKIYFDEGNKPPSAIVSEKIPEGFEIIDVGKGYYDSTKRTVKWLFLPMPPYIPLEDTILNYRIKAPENQKTVAFNGVVNIGNKTFTTEGDIILKVGCVEKWVCTEWSPCENKIQFRECSDKNKCGTEKNKPITERECETQKTSQTGHGNMKNRENETIKNKTHEIQNKTQEKKDQERNILNQTEQTKNQGSQSSVNQNKSEEKLEKTQGTERITGNITGISITTNAGLMFLILVTLVLIFLNFNNSGKIINKGVPWESSISKFWNKEQKKF